MRLATLRLQSFRNHLDSQFDFGDGINVLLGDNGQGKTNVIEAISYLCLTKSFYAGSDSLVVQFGAELFELEGILHSDADVDYRVRVAYSDPQAEKVYAINRLKVEPFSSIIGKFPVVICSPEHAPITTEGPLERRKFVDLIISQSSAIYFQNLLEYRKVLRQRNKILLDGKLARKHSTSVLEPWDEQLLKYGSALMHRRQLFVKEFQSFITEAYHHLVGGEEEPSIGYRSMSNIEGAETPEEIKNILIDELHDRSDEEQRAGSSLVGPHRDEFPLKINGLDLRKFASQGQHKTFLVAMKLGEFFYLRERCNETPILLLDDVFSELDEHRSSRLLVFVEELSQTFITSTNPHLFQSGEFHRPHNRMYRIQNGSTVDQQTFAA